MFCYLILEILIFFYTESYIVIFHWTLKTLKSSLGHSVQVFVHPRVWQIETTGPSHLTEVTSAGQVVALGATS